LVIVCEDLDGDDATAVAGRVLDAVTSAGLEAVGSPATASIGLVVAPAGADPSDVLTRADGAMYRAKTAGGGRVVAADEVAGSGRPPHG
jgi:GGDEF domain-containing protein